MLINEKSCGKDFLFQKVEMPNQEWKDFLGEKKEWFPNIKEGLARDLFEEMNLWAGFSSDKYHVQARELLPSEHGFPDDKPPIWLSIKRHDKEAFHDWRVFQRIKNAILGEEWEGVEIYPAESRLVDTCNQYHLFCWSDTFPIYVFNSRALCNGEESKTRNTKQRELNDY